tara:strand:- start:1152 stop:1295 length:144 start_codon:yes stop_codon:yes gene_type:complete
MTEEIKWDLEDLKKSIIDNAAEYDRIVRRNRDEDDIKERETKSTGEE